MPIQGLAEIRRGLDLVQLMDGIFVAIVVDEEGQGCVGRIGDAGTHPMALEACVTRNGTIGCASAQSVPCSKLLLAQPPR